MSDANRGLTEDGRKALGYDLTPLQRPTPSLDALIARTEQDYQRRTDVIALFCTGRPPRVYVVEDGDGLMMWINTHKRPELQWADAQAIMHTARLMLEET